MLTVGSISEARLDGYWCPLQCNPACGKKAHVLLQWMRHANRGLVVKAVGYKTPGPLDRQLALQDIELPAPTATGRDLLVAVQAVSVNPVDTKVRASRTPAGEGWQVLGYDAAGIVQQVGPEVRGFQAGDSVYYAGSIARPGTNSELHLVDERIVASKPASLTFAQAAALPLTAITAWEMLFDRLDVRRPPVDGGKLILVIGGAGGVGSITIQLLRALTDCQVIATASRPQTRKWVQQCGAHHVLDHGQPLASQVAQLGLGAPGFVFSTTQTEKHLTDIVELIAPQGRFGLIDDPAHLDIRPFKLKSISVHWELMFTRSLYGTPDLAEQGQLLHQLASLVDEGRVHSTLAEVVGKINAATLRRVHGQIEAGSACGKLVLEGFE